MLTTTRQDIRPTITFGGKPAAEGPNELAELYQQILIEQRLSWTKHLRLIKLLGSGGQGVVYQTELRGTDNFTLPVAVKIFSPERFDDAQLRRGDAADRPRAARVAQIQHDNLLDVHNFVDRNRIRMMEMEWIDGYDLARLLVPDMLERIRDRVSNRRWEYINNVIVTAGPLQPRLKPGIAVAIVRDCLAALAALHREGIVHGDIKPSNIMLKRTGNAKIIDIGSAFEMRDPPPRPHLHAGLRRAGGAGKPRDHAAERPLLAGLRADRNACPAGRRLPAFSDIRELLEAKRTLAAAAA